MELSRQRHGARLRAALLASSALIAAPAAALDATWLAVPPTADWNAPTNWNPATVPTGTATFDASNKTSLTFSAVTTNIDTLQFNAGAPAYTFTLNQVIANQTLNINGTGIVNSSSFAPTLAISGINAPQISVLNFNNGSTAGNAIIDNSGGSVSFNNTSTAGTANITNSVFLQFINSSTAGSSTIASSGNVGFGDSSTAGNANITIGVGGSGSLGFLASATAGDATITTNFNAGGPAATLFFQTSSGGNARFITNAGGGVDFSFLTTAGTTAGSIEGAGTYFLGSKNLTVGSNNLSTEVSGAIVDGGSINPSTGGSLTKVGTGTLLLSGTNGYSGGTTISGGTVQVTNADSVGSGAVTLDGGTFQVFGLNTIGFSNDFKINTTGGTVDNNGNVLELAGVISNGNGTTGVLQLTDSTGGGITLLSGVNTYTGGTNVLGTTVQVNNDSSVGTGLVTLENAVFMAADNVPAGSLTFTNNFAINNTPSGSAFDANGWSMTIAGNIADGTGPGKVTVLDSFGGGVLIFTGDKTYTGGTTICFCGTLQLGTLATPGSILGPVTNEGVLNVINSNTSLITTLTNDGGETNFFNATDASAITIVNQNFGATIFHDTSSAANANITNSLGAAAVFLDNATAGNATITNNFGGFTEFGQPFGTDTPHAGTATITTNNGGFTDFNAASSADHAKIIVNSGGEVDFWDTSTADHATITNTAGTVQFNDTSSAGTASISTTIASFGNIIFNNSSTAANATINLVDGNLTFNNSSTAGNATIAMPDAMHPGNITFNDTASAGNANITNVANAVLGTSVQFLGASTAGNATITNNPGAPAGEGGTLFFGTLGGTDTSNAGTAHITNNQFGSTSFLAHTSAMNATIVNNNGGNTNFQDQSTAGNAIIVNNSGGTTSFGVPLVGTDTASAGSSVIINNSGGTTAFFAATTAGSATIINSLGGIVQFGDSGGTNDTATAGSSTIDNSGNVSFNSKTTAGAATITTHSGGNVFFFDASSGGGARFITDAGGTVDISALTSAGTTAGSIEGAGSYVLGAKNFAVGSNNLSTQVSGVISGVGGSLTKVGTGTLILSGTNTYTGGTTISGGTLQLGNGGATGSVVGNVLDNGVLAVNHSNVFTFANVISGAGAFRQIGIGTTVLTADNTYTGGTTISAGTLQLGNGGASGSIAGNVTNNSNLAFNRSDAVTFGGVISGSGVVVQKGPGTLTLTNANTYSGGTTVAGGTLSLQNNHAAGTGAITTTGSVIDYGNGIQIDNPIVLNSNTTQLQVLTGAATQTGVISETGGARPLEKIGAGALILTATNIYSGPTTITAGTLQLGNGGASGSVAGNIVDNATLAINRSDNFVLANTISGSGALQQNGAGITRLTGANTYSGGTTISSGTLQLGAGGAGATSGSITGNVVDNGILAFGRSDAMTFSGVISGTGTVVQQNGGTTTLTGANTYSGGTFLNNGILAVSANANLGAASGGLTFNGGTLRALADFNSSRPVTLNAAGGTIGTNGFNVGWGGVISGVGGLTKNGNGALVLTADNTYTGGTTISGGQLRLGNGGTAGSILGDVTDNAAFSINRSDSYTFAGLISGTGSFNQIGTGTTVLTNDSTYAGGTTISAGTLQLGNGGTTGSFVGDVANNGTLAFNRSNALTFGGVISGTGAVAQNGTGSTNLTATNTYTGATSVNAGTLFVNGSIASSSSLTVNAGGTIGGSGALPKTTINGGTLSPGNSIGTIAVGGSLTFVGAGNYLVEVSPAAADRTNVSGAPGTAALAGALSAVGTGGSYTVGTRYTVLNATGGVSGTFGSLSVSGSFGATKPHIEYDANNVFLVLDPNALSLTGLTPNERSVATSINTALLAGNTSAPFVALFGLTAAQLPGALDQLSGEVHPSTASVLLDESLYARSAILGRLRQASYGGDTGMASLSAGGPTAFANGEELSALSYAKSPIVTKAPPLAAQPSSDVVFWAQGFGAWGRFDSDGNAASVRRDLAGFFTGVDTRVGSNGRLGIAAGYTGSKNTLDNRGGSTVETGHIAGYGGWSFGGLNLRGGGDFAFHTIDTSRTVFFPGFFDTDTAHYNGSTGQIFGEAGYGFAFGKVAVEPFAGAAFVRLQTDAFNERGGAAALTVAAGSFEVGYSTLGIRAATMIPLAADMMLVPRASAAWQHAFDTVTPTDTMAFQSAGVPFVIAGVPIARDSALAEAGLDLAIGRNATIGISYVGQLANNVQDHAAKGKFSWKF